MKSLNSKLMKTNLAPLCNPILTLDRDRLIIRWDDNSQVGNASASDLFACKLTQSSTGESKVIHSLSARCDRKFIYHLPSELKGRYDVEAVFIDERHHRRSESSLLGQLFL